MLRAIRPLRFILVFTFVLNLFFYGRGHPYCGSGAFMRITHGGLSSGGALTACGSLFLVIGTSLLTLTTSPISLTDGVGAAAQAR